MVLGALSTMLAALGSNAALASSLVLLGASVIRQAAFRFGLHNDSAVARQAN